MELSPLLPPKLVDAYQKFPAALGSCLSIDAVMRLKGAFIGRENSHILRLMDLLKRAPNDRKKELGTSINFIKCQWEEAIKCRLSQLEKSQQRIATLTNNWDSSLPPPLPPVGGIHPLMNLMNYIVDIFQPMGFHVEEGPEIETEYNNFDGLNIPYGHPARNSTETFYFKNQNKTLLRTHTSSVQVRVLKRIGAKDINGKSELEYNGGIRFLAPGRVYRKDEFDPTHSPMFHQIEGMVVGKKIGMHHLKGVLTHVMKVLFNQDTDVRFRPSYFSFVEPGVEIDVRCYLCNGNGCRICKNSGWVELLGAGLLHPNVLTMADIDPNIWSGFALGMGVERIAMMISQTPDLRLFFENDQRFLMAMGRLD